MNDFSRQWVNLASSKLGAAAAQCSDDFFAPMRRMLEETAPVFIDGKYDEHGKWMDGWESRRKREPGNDWCVVRLATPGVLHGVEIDTTHFTGNYPPAASLDACSFDGECPPEDMEWTELIARADLQGDSLRRFEIKDARAWTHVRLNIFPDGGVARLRVYGAPKIDWEAAKGERVDLAAALNGAVALCCNDEHFGSIRNLLAPGRGVNMGDGWETRRRREPGNDWVVVALAHPGVIREIEIDTAHFKGNFPDGCSLQGALLQNAPLEKLPAMSEKWQELLPRVKLQADKEHRFRDEIAAHNAVSHVRLNIYPDGGVSRLRLFGEVSDD
ncbi:MAG: allantoicase [Gammaproteobacteria bacterium]|nr:allantoicase [Gammaproteobacteria bacterium]